MFTIRIGLPSLAFFHLITHALFKALLFICAGYIINIHHHSQDLRTMGNIVHQMPIVTRMMLIANIALCGAPFIAGFYSKDTIIEQFTLVNKNAIITLMFITATVLTTAYSTRFSIYVLIGPTYSPASQYSSESLSEAHATTTLGAGAIVGGSTVNWLLIPPTTEAPIHLADKTQPIAIILVGLIVGIRVFYAHNRGPSALSTTNMSMWHLTPIVTHSFHPELLTPSF